VSDRITGFEDWTSRLLDLADLSLEDRQELDGISFADTLLGQPQPERRFLYREFVQQQAIWSGPWRGIRSHLAKADDPQAKRTELYDLVAAPSESHDASAQHPEIMARLERVLRKEHHPSELFPIPVLDAK